MKVELYHTSTELKQLFRKEKDDLGPSRLSYIPACQATPKSNACAVAAVLTATESNRETLAILTAASLVQSCLGRIRSPKAGRQ